MNYLDVVEAKQIYKQGKNVTQYLRNKFDKNENTGEIIEIAYDLQAGSYIKSLMANSQHVEAYATEVSDILKNHLVVDDTLLDVGTGEITTLNLVLNRITVPLTKVLAFDISWSRLYKGLEFHQKNNDTNVSVETFVADMKEIPLRNKCIDVTTSNGALEPNGKSLNSLLQELFRITKKKLVLFEPSYELNSKEGRERMDNLGYIKNIEGEVKSLGGKVINVIPMSIVENPLNPTVCYIIEPPEDISVFLDAPAYSVPGTDLEIEKIGSFMSSKDTGLIFPILDGIPVLRTNKAILATAKF